MSNARQVDLLLSGIFGLDGAPLSGGKVYCYNAGSSTLKNVYNDVGLTVASENPVILDENGKAIKYALGSYKFVVKDANDSTLYTYDNLTYGFNPESVTADYSGSIYLASMGGDSSAMQGSTTLTTPISSLAEGMRFVFQSPFDCADDATIAIDEADAADLYIADGSTPVTAGYIEEGQFYEIIYDGSVFRVLSTTSAIGTDKIGIGVITGSNIQSSAVDTAQLNDGAVTTSKIDNGAITENKIGIGAVVEGKIGAEAVTGANIKDYTITGVKIYGQSIADYHFVTGACIDSLTQNYEHSGSGSIYQVASVGKRFFISTATQGSVYLDIAAADYPVGSLLFFTKVYSGSNFFITKANSPVSLVATVDTCTILMKSHSDSWIKILEV